MTTLDPATYGDYEQDIKFSISGAHLKWSGVPAIEMERIGPIIRETGALWSADYDTSLKAGANWLYLTVEHRETPTPVRVRNLKGEAFALMVATSWGGP